jgi:hypothetical protein
MDCEMNDVDDDLISYGPLESWSMNLFMSQEVPSCHMP